MASIFLYKIEAPRDGGSTGTVYRYEIDNLGDVSINLDQPVSPMPLPMADAAETILVKMEGNTEKCTVSWKITDKARALFKQKTAATSDLPSSTQAENDALYANGISTNPNTNVTTSSYFHATNDNDTTTPDTASGTVDKLRKSFQGKDIADEYFLVLPNQTVMKGWVMSWALNVSGSSPVVWNGSFTFITGNVMSIYDADSPSEPRDIALHAVDNNGKASGESGFSGATTKLRLRWKAPTDTASNIVKYNVYAKTDTTSFVLHESICVHADGDCGSVQNLDGAVSGDSNYKEYSFDGTSNKKYIFRVTASNVNGGEGMKSDEVSEVNP